MDHIELVVPHQANLRIIEAAARGLHLPLDRFMVNVERYGNTSSASIPIAVCEAFENGRIRPGDHVVLVGFGAGLTWGAMALEWVSPDRPVRPGVRPRHRLLTLFAHLASLVRRVWRRIEGLIWGASSEPSD
jgi:3-oxoacyl-[acyl-carrier-protein] synthase-3